jgi:hypothetical protein
MKFFGKIVLILLTVLSELNFSNGQNPNLGNPIDKELSAA